MTRQSSKHSSITTTTGTTEKVIIFDWDDTICPSSFVDQWDIQSFHDLPLHFQNLFNEIGKEAERCLAAAAQHGTVLIITNSDDGWVNYSAERYIPNLLPVIAKYRIVSARTRYECFYPNQPLCWKAAAFAHEVNECFGTEGDKSDGSLESMVETDVSEEDSDEMMMTTNNNNYGKRKKNVMKKNEKRKEVVSFGDSMEERTAVQIVSDQLSAIPKSVMFVTSPTPVQLLGELSMLTSQMEYVCNHSTVLDLEISPTQAQKCAEDYLGSKNNNARSSRSSSSRKSMSVEQGPPHANAYSRIIQDESKQILVRVNEHAHNGEDNYSV